MLKKEFKSVLGEIEHKKQILTYMQEEVATLPVDVNRNQYLKRINEIIRSLKMVNTDIRANLDDIKIERESTLSLVKDVQGVDIEVEDLVFKDTAKEKVSKQIYDEIQNLKKTCDLLVSSAQEENKLKTQIREIQNKLDDFRIKYKNMSEIEKLKTELQQVVNENAKLQAQLIGSGQ